MTPNPKLTGAVVALSALSAFAFLPPPVSLEAPRFAVLLLAAAAWVALWTSGSLAPVDAEARSLLVPAAVAAGVALVSAVLAFSPGMALTYGAEASLLGLPSWLAMLAVFLLASRAPLSRWTHAGLEAGAVVAVAMGAWAITQAARGLTTDAIFGNADYLGVVLLLFLPVAAVSLWRARGARIAVAAAGAIVLVVGAALGGVVTVTVAVVVELLLLLAATPAERFPKPLAGVRRPAGIAGAALLAVGVVGLAFGVLRLALPGVSALSFAAPIAAQPTFLSRFELWRAGLAVWLAHPLLGTGPDGLWLASQSSISSRLMTLEGGVGVGADVLVRDPHMLPLLALAQLGVAGTAALAWLAVAWARVLRGRAAEDAALATVRLAYGAGVVTFLFAMLLIPWTVRFAAVPALLAGLAVAPGPRREKPAGRGKAAAGRVAVPTAAVRRLVWLWAPAAVVLVAALVLGGTALAGDYLIGRAKAASTPADAASAYGQAIAVQPTRPYPRYELLYLKGYELAADGVGTIAEYRAAVDAAPKELLGNGPYLANLVQVAVDYVQVSRSLAALTWESRRLAEAARLAPNDQDVVLEQARLAMLRGDLAGAAAQLARIGAEGTRNPRFALYEAMLARARKEPGADAALQRAVQLAPYLGYLTR